MYYIFNHNKKYNKGRKYNEGVQIIKFVFKMYTNKFIISSTFQFIRTHTCENNAHKINTDVIQN